MSGVMTVPPAKVLPPHAHTLTHVYTRPRVHVYMYTYRSICVCERWVPLINKYGYVFSLTRRKRFGTFVIFIQ